ncbi:polysaccharide pyruvyl transferase family protein [Gilvimarinus sp. F26214L]|uniref:polysaccharide pyruvyl transferase family protein n=1 Tax=Gilvimarinus sp. DZF01 TaxID=3461371 RepID=UPI0040458A9C
MNRPLNAHCLIVTLCRSPNFGAYLQAFALKEVLAGYGYKVSFLDIYDEANNKKRLQFFFRGWKRRPFTILFNIRKLLAFRSAEKLLSIIPRGELSQFRAVFIGSDEIWSVTNGTFNSVPEFFGLNLGDLLTFSYAPSVGNSSVEDMRMHPEFVKGLNKLDMLSVRDGESYEVATKAARRDDVTLVLDPTFLHDFSSNEEKFDVGCRYLLVYTYGFSDDDARAVKAYARQHGLKVISAGFNHRWVDRNISCNPFEFLSLVKAAECVITDTFHGSIFAIKYQRNFISCGRHKNKVKYLLESLGLEDSLVDAGRLVEGRLIETDYSRLKAKLAPLISDSREYLERCNDMVRG